MAVNRATVEVKTVQPPRHDKHTDIADRAQVNKLSNLVLNESFVDQEDNEALERDTIQSSINVWRGGARGGAGKTYLSIYLSHAVRIDVLSLTKVSTPIHNYTSASNLIAPH